MHYNDLSREIIDTAIQIHRVLGPGLLESVYHEIMYFELKKKGFDVLKEVPVPIVWDGIKLNVGYRADLIVEDRIIIELKSVEKLNPVHQKQLLTYLKLADKKLGLLINFGQKLLKDGLSRVVNGFEES